MSVLAWIGMGWLIIVGLGVLFLLLFALFEDLAPALFVLSILLAIWVAYPIWHEWVPQEQQQVNSPKVAPDPTPVPDTSIYGSGD